MIILPIKKLGTSTITSFGFSIRVVKIFKAQPKSLAQASIRYAHWKKLLHI